MHALAAFLVLVRYICQLLYCLTDNILWKSDKISVLRLSNKLVFLTPLNRCYLLNNTLDSDVLKKNPKCLCTYIWLLRICISKRTHANIASFYHFFHIKIMNHIFDWYLVYSSLFFNQIFFIMLYNICMF